MTKQEKARWVAKMHLAYADGKTIQAYRSADAEWKDATTLPCLSSDPCIWRIKPEPRECETTVFSYKGESRVMVPRDWQPGTRVRVVEVLEDE